LAASAAAAAIVASTALAAPLVVGASRVGSGNTPVTACDTDGFTHTYATSGGDVTSITVGGIASPACNGGSMRVTVTDASGAALASAGPQTIGSGATSITLATSPQASAALVAGVNIAIAGP
jgi:hypothetical protein